VAISMDNIGTCSDKEICRDESSVKRREKSLYIIHTTDRYGHMCTIRFFSCSLLEVSVRFIHYVAIAHGF
jgi:hypothetical protein